MLRDIPFELPHHSYIYYLTKIGCLGHEQLSFIFDKLVQTDEKILRAELKKVDANGFQFLIYLIKKFTEAVHPNFQQNYNRYLKDSLKEHSALISAF